MSREPETISADVEIRFVSINTGRDIQRPLTKTINIVPNETTSVWKGTIQEAIEEPHVLAVRLWVGERLVSRDCDWPQPFKYLDFQNRGLHVEPTSSPGAMRVSADRPVKGLVFEERADIVLDDNCLDVIPGDPQTVQARGLRPEDAPFRWWYVGMDSER
jgi:beta-mannosidase